MQKLKLLLTTVLVSIGVALTYHYFEAAVRHSTNYIWDTLLNTQTKRWLVVPACVVLSLVFFGVQHYLDPGSEEHVVKGLGADMPKPTLTNFAKVLFIGFLSLVAGASLGPEAILVPASLILGAYLGTKAFKKDGKMIKLMAMIGFVALFAAFFHAFIAGMLGLLLVIKQTKGKLSASLVLLGAVASIVTVFVLKLVSGSSYLELPQYTWHISAITAVTLVVLFAAGVGITFALKGLYRLMTRVEQALTKHPWWLKGLVAALGLSALYILGGNLVMFTGNESIIPMLNQAPSLGLIGLTWLLVVKLGAIAWSKALGYRGGLIFPSLFAASVCVAFSQLVAADVNFIYGFIAVIVGLLVADSKAKFLV